MSILPEQLKDFDYYVSKVPLYLQNSYGFIEHFRIWFDFLIDASNEGDKLLSLINIFEDDYLNKINALDEDGSDFLDKIGSIFNIKRNFSISYIEQGTTYKEQVSLDNEHFLTFLRAQIIKNYSNGTYEQMREFYDKAHLLVYFNTSTSSNTEVNLINISSSIYEYDNLTKKLFLAGLFTIESAGINYSYAFTNYDKLLIWDKEVSGNYTGWDYGEWSI